MTRERPAALRLDGAPARPPRRDGQARRIALAGEAVDYRLIRARRRTIGMEVDLDGLTVRAPRWVTLREIEEALTERAALDRARARRMARAPPRRAAARMEDRARRSSTAAASSALAVFPARATADRAPICST